MSTSHRRLANVAHREVYPPPLVPLGVVVRTRPPVLILGGILCFVTRFPSPIRIRKVNPALNPCYLPFPTMKLDPSVPTVPMTVWEVADTIATTVWLKDVTNPLNNAENSVKK